MTCALAREGRRALACLALALLPTGGFAEELDTPETDLTKLDLTGAWYVLIHYKDDRSEDESITKFVDFAWSIEQTASTITWDYYPFVLFDPEAELERRYAMRGHEPWEPTGENLAKLANSVDVSSRAMTRKRLTGSVAEGFRSLAPLASGGLHIVSFARNWDVRFKPDAIEIVITDTLSGAVGLEPSEERIVYRVTEQLGPHELRGSYAEATKRGTLRMIRAGQRRVVK